jgi:cobalt-precorrin-5B (C1)-methyltransferase
MDDKPRGTPLRHGWTTGACATAAARAAAEALRTGRFPDPVEIALPSGARVAFALAGHRLDAGWAEADVIKDAGDDPDVTHGALIRVRVEPGPPGSGVTFRASEGVGTVTKPGLPIPPGEPAINPVPRQMIRAALDEAGGGDWIVTVSVPGGQRLAERTLNPRLGILGGISILGTRGTVIPFSCSAWIHSIHRGIDVARAAGLTHVAGATGNTSERAIAALDGLPETALIDMGDFAGGMLKYLRKAPVPRVTVAGGFAKLSKLAQGRLDLHSRSGAVDLAALGAWAGGGTLGARIEGANTALEALDMARGAGVDLAAVVAEKAAAVAAGVVAGRGIGVDVAVFDRQGALLTRSGVVG